MAAKDANQFKGALLMQVGFARDHRVAFKSRDKDGKPLGDPYAVKIDRQSLRFIADYCNSHFPNGVKLKNTHDGDATDYLGLVRTPIRVEGDSLRGDLELNPGHNDIDSFRWAIENLQDTFGISAGTTSTYEFTDDAALLRPIAVQHFAVEDECAATPSLFNDLREHFSTKKSTTVDKPNTTNMKASDPATIADLQPFKTQCEQMAADIAEMKKNFAAATTRFDAMDSYAKKLDEFSAQFAAFAKQAKTDGKTDADADDDDDANLKAVRADITNLAKAIPTAEQFKKLADESAAAAVATFASQRLGQNFRMIPAVVAADGKDANGKDIKPYVEICDEAVKAGQFKNRSEAMSGLRNSHRDSWNEFRRTGAVSLGEAAVENMARRTA